MTEESLENDLELADICWSSTNKPSQLIQASNELKVCMYRILRTRVWNVQSLSCEEDNSDMHAAGNRNRQNGIQINENCELTKSSILMISIYLFFSFFWYNTFSKRAEKCKELLNDNHHNFYSTAAIQKRKREKQVRTIYHACNWIQAFPHESTQHCVAVTAAVTGVDRMCPDYAHVI